MQFEKHQQAAKLLRPHPSVLYALPPARASHLPARVEGRERLLVEPPASLETQSGLARGELFLPRCRQKGCVFPGLPGGQGECAYHRRQTLEPDCFHSQQPSFLLLEQAKFGLPDSEPQDERLRDRHRLAEQRVRFMLGDAA